MNCNLESTALCALLLLAISSCHSASARTDADNRLDVSDADDSQVEDREEAESDDGWPDSDGRATDTTEGVTAEDTGADGGVDADRAAVDFDDTYWKVDNACDGTTAFEDPSGTFSNPPPPDDYDPVFTRQRIEDTFGRLPTQGSILEVDAGLQPRSQKPFELFATPGTDIKLFLAAINDYTDQELQSFRQTVTVMVDYEPVQANYTRWKSDRSAKIEEHVAQTGFHFDINQPVEIVDITIPARAFAEERMYEVSVFYETTTVDREPVGKSYRFALFNGGLERPGRPCIEPKIDTEVLDVEVDAFSRTSDDIAVVFPEGIAGPNDLRRVLDVEPGATREIYLTLFGVYAEADDFFLVPMLNGQPFGQGWWLEAGGGSSEFVNRRVDARKSFSVTFPEEPGIYEVQVASWRDPFELFRLPDGTRVEGVTRHGGLLEGSNALRFRVVEPPE